MGGNHTQKKAVSARRPNERRWACWLVLLGLVSPWLGGCAQFWDDLTSNDHDVHLFSKGPDPKTVLAESKDGDKRGRAFQALTEPKAHGGKDSEQDYVMEVLTAAVKNEPQFYSRREAVRKLGEFKDPRVPAALVEAYYSADYFKPDYASTLRCEALKGLGQNGNPAGMDLLIKVVREAKPTGPESERRMVLDERNHAARALAHFSQPQAAEALLFILKTEKDVSLRSNAHESLEVCTGKKLPLDAQMWDDQLHKQPGQGEAVAGTQKKGFLDFLQVGFWSK
jgi:PBS lyase HEAT-like repeat